MNRNRASNAEYAEPARRRRARLTRRPGMGIVALSAAVSVFAGVTVVPAAASRPLSSTTNQMTFVAQHPWAAAQPTNAGRQLSELQVHEGKVWAGYGDYAANTGPIELASVDPTSGEGFESSMTVDTEAILNIRVLDDSVVAPATDPRAQADYAIGEPWLQARPLGATHVFDSASLGGDLWMVGSQGADAIAWRSTDHGSSWNEELRVAPTSGRSNDFQRFYFAATLQGRLYVQAVSYSGGAADTSLVYEGGQWQTGPDMLPVGLGWSPEVVGDSVVYQSSGQGRGSTLLSFDGLQARQHGSAFDVESAGGSAWMLDTEGRILQSTDLKRWKTVVQGPADGRSLAVDGDNIYVGTASSELWSYRVTDSPDRKEQEGKGGSERCPAGWAKKGRC